MPKPLLELWKENHGNLLLATLIAIVLVGSSILLYEQNRFIPVSFPDASSIQPIDANEGRFLIEIVNAESDLGQILVAIYPDETSFNHTLEAIFRQTMEIVDQQALVIVPLENLPEQFAVAAYHDKNGNGVLDLNVLGIPTERYGFSRNARGFTGAPRFSDAVISRPTSEQSIEIVLQ